MSEQDQLHELDWVSIPNQPYIMKYMFSDTSYSIIVSNLSLLYSEKITDINIQERFCKLNPYVQMKSQVILENLKKSLLKCLNEESHLNINVDGNKLIISLKFPVAHALCNYDIELDLLTANEVMQYIISPTIFGALLSQKKILEIQKGTSSDKDKFSIPSDISVSSQCVLEPEWLQGKNIPIKVLLDSFLNIQDHFKYLFAQNYEAHSNLRKDKSKNTSSIESGISEKKCKLEKNAQDESTSVKFEEPKERFYLREDVGVYSYPEVANSSKNEKKKKTFKI